MAKEKKRTLLSLLRLPQGKDSLLKSDRSHVVL